MPTSGDTPSRLHAAQLQSSPHLLLCSPAVLHCPLSSVVKHLSHTCRPVFQLFTGRHRVPRAPSSLGEAEPCTVRLWHFLITGRPAGGVEHVLILSCFFCSRLPVCGFTHLSTQLLIFLLLTCKSSLSLLVSTRSVLCIANARSHSGIVFLAMFKAPLPPLQGFPFCRCAWF